MTGGPLAGIRVLDLSRVLAGPYCTMVLADLGADVVKIERPGAGDDLRAWGPPYGPGGDSTYFQTVNRNKTGMAVDLKSPSGLELVRELARTSDVVVENFRVGMAEELGLGYEDLSAANPGLVYCSVSGFGRTGPLAQQPGYDVLMQAMGGLMSVTGERDGAPMRSGVAIVDICTGLYAAVGIVAALNGRTTTGRGQRVDLSLLESVLAIQPNLTAGYLIAGMVPQRLGNAHPNVTPYGVFPTSDGHIVLAVGNDGQWARLVRALDVTADAEGLDTSAVRMSRRDEVDKLVASWTSRSSTARLSALLAEHDIPQGPVMSVPEALEHPQVQALGTVATHPLGADASGRLVRSPIRLSDERTDTLAPPSLRRPTAERLRQLGLPGELIARLAESGGLEESPDHS
ncbi:CaiB/BaiF CoA transferase family protein [Amycolatopsis pithecellobii]|uniref:CoA transferase n=1 Tax=Amycolatopsis pithecellobii TaxID=664692 RepID=A0A6N7YMY9_9PSEU|nr:CoA transferase [Amycolatopsis pithecellobii]MTD54347.1 CoA transferase [Amycolatopsis pithecellobii]